MGICYLTKFTLCEQKIYNNSNIDEYFCGTHEHFLYFFRFFSFKAFKKELGLGLIEILIADANDGAW